MARVKIRCFNCGDEHSNDSKHFPRRVLEVITNKEGKKENKPVGYICRKCILKQMLSEAGTKSKQKGVIKIK